MERKLFVLSIDAMVGEDVEQLWSRPNFSRLMARCARVKQTESVYPSITYPAHVSIMTGCRPGRHGVFTNGAFKTGGGGTDWHYHCGVIQTEDIFTAAKRAGCSTAAVYWPVTGCHPDIDYLIDEYFFPDPAEAIEEGFAKLGSNQDALQVVRENLDRFPTQYRNRTGDLCKAQTFDDFIIGCVCSMIRRLRPDVLLAHHCYLDSLRHRYGLFHPNIQEGLDITDQWLGEIMEAMEDAGTYEQTDFVILSDHGQMDYIRRVQINALLARGGFIDLSDTGEVKDWRAFAQTNGMSATIFLKDAGDQQLHQQVLSYLQTLCDSGAWGFSEVLSREQAKETYGTDGGFSFILETDGYSTFSNDCRGPAIVPTSMTDYRMRHATHGYRPEKGPQPVFLGRGPGFQPGAVVEKAHLIDIAPTLAGLLGARLPAAEGHCLDALLARPLPPRDPVNNL